MLAAASIARLPLQVVLRVALLTHGSPLGRLYGRFFPAYFGTERLQQLADRVGGRWTNLFRWTDPIGGPIGIDDVEIGDPASAARRPGDPLPKILGHTFTAERWSMWPWRLWPENLVTVEAIMVGAGRRGHHVYGRWALQRPDRLRFLAVADPDPDKVTRFQQAHRIADRVAIWIRPTCWASRHWRRQPSWLRRTDFISRMPRAP